MSDSLPHFMDLNGLIVNVDKILYIRESEANVIDSLIGFGDHIAEKELHVEGLTPTQLFGLLNGYEKHLREVKAYGLT